MLRFTGNLNDLAILPFAHSMFASVFSFGLSVCEVYVLSVKSLTQNVVFHILRSNDMRIKRKPSTPRKIRSKKNPHACNTKLTLNYLLCGNNSKAERLVCYECMFPILSIKNSPSLAISLHCAQAVPHLILN